MNPLKLSRIILKPINQIKCLIRGPIIPAIRDYETRQTSKSNYGQSRSILKVKAALDEI